MDDESTSVIQLGESNVSLRRYAGLELHSMVKKRISHMQERNMGRITSLNSAIAKWRGEHGYSRVASIFSATCGEGGITYK